MTIKENKILFAVLMLDFIGILLTLAFNSTIMADELEHLRNSYLISIGYIPYRDFFEHHHPLLWFIFSPLFMLLPQNITLFFYIARSVALICSAISLYIWYLLIKRFLKSVEIFGYFLAFLFIFYPTWYCFSVFKPDVFARMFYMFGLYLYFCYLENFRVKELFFCSIYFTVSFLFLQTIVFSIIPLLFPLVYLFYKNKKFWYDASVCTIFPVLIISGCVCLMVKYNLLDEYIRLNITFNHYLFLLLYPNTPSMLWHWSPYIAAAILAWIRIWKNTSSKYWRICGWLFVCELLQHIYFPAVLPQYLILLFVFSALSFAYFYDNIKKSSFRIYIYGLLATNLVLNLFTLWQHNNLQRIKLLQQINSSVENQVLNINYEYVNIFAVPRHYYSTGFNNLAIIDDYLFHRFPEYNVNYMVLKYKPQYINAQKPENFSFPEADRLTLQEESLQYYEKIADDLYRRKDLYEHD